MRHLRTRNPGTTYRHDNGHQEDIIASPRHYPPGILTPRLPGSALATVDDTRLSRVSRCKMCMVMATPCVLIGASLLLMNLLPTGPRKQLARENEVSLWIQQLGNACTTVGCKRAVAELSSSIDTSVDPCQDFYSFACGRWGQTKHDASYMEAQRLAYVAAVNGSLSNTSHFGFGFSHDYTLQMSTVYRSCLIFFDREPVNMEEAWSASGIGARSWIGVSSFDTLFTLVVRTVLQYNMESVVNVRWTDDANSASTAPSVRVEVSTGSAIARHLDSSFRKEFIMHAFEVLGGVQHDHIPQIEHIDDTVLQLIRKISSRVQTEEINIQDLDTATANWSRVLIDYAKVFDKPAPSKVRVRNLYGVGNVLNFLGRANLGTVAIYLTLVPLAKFLVLVSHVQLRVVSDRGYDENNF
ncbi:hypothetical protein V5799_009736, partial [Amblyomma americanum]